MVWLMTQPMQTAHHASYSFHHPLELFTYAGAERRPVMTTTLRANFPSKPCKWRSALQVRWRNDSGFWDGSTALVTLSAVSSKSESPPRSSIMG